MPRLQITVEVPQSDYHHLEEVADYEGITVRGLLVWLFKSDLAERSKLALAARQPAIATEPDAA
jgi:hypothetical protein